MPANLPIPSDKFCCCRLLKSVQHPLFPDVIGTKVIGLVKVRRETEASTFDIRGVRVQSEI